MNVVLNVPIQLNIVYICDNDNEILSICCISNIKYNIPIPLVSIIQNVKMAELNSICNCIFHYQLSISAAHLIHIFVSCQMQFCHFYR